MISKLSYPAKKALGHILTVGIIICAFSTTEAQSTYKISQFDMNISGTSTLHDWTAEVEAIKGEGEVEIKDNHLVSIKDLKVSIPVTTIKSGKKSMDKNIYEALKADKNPYIEYTFTKVEKQEQGILIASGNLKVNGVSRSLELETTYNIQSPEKLTFKGEANFKMTDFNVDPPTALMGTVKTGNEISIPFTISLEK